MFCLAEGSACIVGVKVHLVVGVLTDGWVGCALGFVVRDFSGGCGGAWLGCRCSWGSVALYQQACSSGWYFGMLHESGLLSHLCKEFVACKKYHAACLDILVKGDMEQLVKGEEVLDASDVVLRTVSGGLIS